MIQHAYQPTDQILVGPSDVGGWVPVKEALPREIVAHMEALHKRRREEDVLLLLQTMFPEVYVQITDMLRARDALLSE